MKLASFVVGRCDEDLMEFFFFFCNLGNHECDRKEKMVVVSVIVIVIEFVTP